MLNRSGPASENRTSNNIEYVLTVRLRHVVISMMCDLTSIRARKIDTGPNIDTSNHRLSRLD